MDKKLRKRNNLNYKKIVFVIVAFISLTFISLGYSYFKTTLGFDSTAITGDVINNCYYVEILGKKMYTCPDNKKSKYVTSDTGIDYTKSASETNGRGLYTLTSTINDTYPIYYYRGNAYDNNVIFANKCWKIVRTTETGGTKLIYNGLPQDGKCDVLGVDKSIGKSAFNENEPTFHPSPGYMGYMYSSATADYTYDSKSYSSSINRSYYSIGTNKSPNFYFATSYTYSGGKYSLSNPVQFGAWKDVYETVSKKGYYTCWLTNTNSCSNLFYISKATLNYAYGLYLYSGNNLSKYNTTVNVATDVVDNNNGTYSLSGNIVSVSKLDFNDDPSSYKGQYVCSNLTSTTCDKVVYLGNIRDTDAYGESVITLTFGNDVVWNGSNYSLQDTYTKTVKSSFKSIEDSVSTRHYTCFTSGTNCNEVYYIVNYDNNNPDYILLKNGKKIEDAINDMLPNSNDLRNENDSTIKTYIESWYENNLNSYDTYLEDTIWCNDRTISSLNSYNKDLTNIYKSNKTWILFGNGKNVEESIKGIDACPNNLDRFTVSSSNGNGKLKYKIGLLTMQEGKIYSNDENQTFTLTPRRIHDFGWHSEMYTTLGYSIDVNRIYEISPSISLKQGVTITSGAGTSENPYIIN